MPKMLYQCDICGAVHTNKKFAEDCEKIHAKPDKTEYVYSRTDTKAKYPAEVKLWFGSQCCKYNRS